MSDPASIAAALTATRERIAEAAHRAGRPAEAVRLLAVSKTHPPESILAALEAGQVLFGENRVQEAAAKFAPLRASHPALRLHLVGALQTNKADEAVALFDVIHSLDRPRLADALARAIKRHGRRPELLVQVNIGDEPQKAGIPTADADRFLEDCARRFGPGLVGLMAIPPAEADPRPFFDRLAGLARRHALPALSMGMSDDYETAIAAGATIVRVGSAIFGARPHAPEPSPEPGPEPAPFQPAGQTR